MHFNDLNGKTIKQSNSLTVKQSNAQTKKRLTVFPLNHFMLRICQDILHRPR